jgi:hypothetical protein
VLGVTEKPTAIVGEVLSGPDDLDAAYAEIRKEPYQFLWPAGRQWSLPHLSDLDYRLMNRIESYTTLTTTELEALFVEILGDQAEQWGQTKVPTPVLYMVFERWIKHCGGELGEEPASSGSSGSTGKSSRRTSGGTTRSGSRSRSTAKKAAPKVASPPGNSST